MPRILALLLAIALLFSLTACGEKEEMASADETQATVQTEEETIPQTVYITQTGKKYHSTKNCSGLSRAKAIYESTLSNAIGFGLGACLKCH